jgi:GNAT superfamily N-acetyltransferase
MKKEQAAAARRAYKMKSERHGRWTEVSAELDGKDVSHLGYADCRIRIGAEATVRMAGIGGVGTDSEHRRRGLARKVFAYALGLMREQRFSMVGLYTSRHIVAHRLYRRFGLVDLVPRRHYVKLLDPTLVAQQMLRELVLRSEELRSRRLTIRLHLGSTAPLDFRIEGNDVSLMPRPPRKVDLTLRLSEKALVPLAAGVMTLEYAEQAKLAAWSGDEAVCQMLSRAIAARRRPISEE